jgi:hypothetical protein
MKIEIVKKDRSSSIANKISGILFGIFITSAIFSLSIKTLEEAGIYLGLAISIILGITGFRYTKKGSITRTIIYGIISSTILYTSLYIIGIVIISKTLEGF